MPLTASINMVGGWLAAALKLPLYLDSLGTVLAGCLAGPTAGLLTALISGLISGLLNSPVWLCFLPTALVLGAACGWLAQNGFMRTPWLAALMGIILGTVTACCSAPITAFMLHGFGGSGMDFLVAAFKAAGLSTMQACLAQGLASDPLDKLITCLVAQALLCQLPQSLRGSFFAPAASTTIRPESSASFQFQNPVTNSDINSELHWAQSYTNLGFYQTASRWLHKLSPSTKFLMVLPAVLLALHNPLFLQIHPEGQEVSQFVPLASLPLIMLAIWILSLTDGLALPFSSTLLWLFLPLSISMVGFNGLLGQPSTTIVLGNIAHFSWSAPAAWSAAQAAGRLTIVGESILIILFTTTNEELLHWGERWGLSPRLAYSLLATLNILPSMYSQARQIIQAQMARAMPWPSSTTAKLKRLMPLLTPLISTALYESGHRAITLEVRGFATVCKRTSLTSPHLSTRERILQTILVTLNVVLITTMALQYIR